MTFSIEYGPIRSTLNAFLPTDILERFDITDTQEQDGNLLVFLQERSLPPDIEGMQVESKGFYPEKTIQDYPVRGRPAYLKVKRRRWRDIKTNVEIPQPWDGVASGTTYTKEFGSFLKEMDRDGTSGDCSDSEVFLRGHETIRKELQRPPE